MKIVFSRKGFDAGTGGCPSPIGPQGELVSLPIPGSWGSPRYAAIQSPLGELGTLVHALSKGHMRGGGERSVNNTVHLASDELVLDGRPTGLPGAGAFLRHHPDLVLSADETLGKSIWRLPAWAAPQPGRVPMSYHGSPERWIPEPETGTVRLQTVAKGEEFVLDVGQEAEPRLWLERQIRTGLGMPLNNNAAPLRTLGSP